MLILSRKVEEAIILELPNGDEIAVVITDIGETRTKVGIEAPSEVGIVREELLFHE